MFNTFVCDVETKGDRIGSVPVANKDGLVRIRPSLVVYCTGDADMAAWPGAPAAGLAAALAAAGKTAAHEIAGTRLREQLVKLNAGPFTDA